MPRLPGILTDPLFGNPEWGKKVRPILRGVEKLVPWQTFLIVSTVSGGRGEKREARGVMKEGNGPGRGVMRDEWGIEWE